MSFKDVLKDAIIENPTEQFVAFCHERHSIYKKKTAGESRPWTTDPIMSKYKFTNLFRDLDRVSVFIFEWVEPLKDNLEVLFANLLYARNCNKISTMQKTGFIIEKDGTVQNADQFLQTIADIGGNVRFKTGWKKSVWGGPYVVAGTFSKVLGYRRREQMIIDYIPKKIKELTQILVDHNCNPELGPLLEKLCDAWGYRNRMVLTQTLLDIAHMRPDILPPNLKPPVLSGVEPLHCVFKIYDPDTLIKHGQDAYNAAYPNERFMEYKDAEHALCEFRKYLCWWRGLQRPKIYKIPVSRCKDIEIL